MKILITAPLLLLVTLHTQKLKCQPKSVIETKMSPIDTFMERKMKETGIVGMGAALIVNKKVVWAKGFGFADREQGKPFTTNTIINIASTAKNFTGVCLMKAIEDKKLSLDEDINTYLPFKVINPYYPNEIITLRNLATHTSSLADRDPVYADSYKNIDEPNEDLGEFLKNYFANDGKYYSKENFINAKPGSHYQYSNVPAALAGYIVELATGKKLPQFGKQLIFKPLKMKNTGWSISQIDLANHSKLYDKIGDTVKNIPLYTFPTYPEGGVRASVSDLARYFAALLNDGEYQGVRILKKESVQAMKRFQFNTSNKPENMNLAKLNSGIFWATKLGATRVGYNGSDPGVRVFMLSDLTEEIGVVMFINTSLTDEGISFDIYDALYKFGMTFKSAKTSNR